MHPLGIDMRVEAYRTATYIQKLDNEGNVRLVSQNKYPQGKDVEGSKYKFWLSKASIRSNSVNSKKRTVEVRFFENFSRLLRVAIICFIHISHQLGGVNHNRFDTSFFFIDGKIKCWIRPVPSF